MSSRPVIAVIGPTAVGKSDLALDIAEHLGGAAAVEIVNADAYQLYRGMDVGTAKVPPRERRGMTHHQFDVLAVDEDASVAHYQESARRDLDAIAARDRRAVVVGGSGLYVRALLDDLRFPGTDAEIRRRWEERAEREGTRVLFDLLTELDPQAAAAIGPHNTRRLVRAHEVIELTGRPYTATLPRQEYVKPTVQIGLALDRTELDERIAVRTERMWRDELVAEVAGLAGPNLDRMGRTAQRAVGYAQVLAMLRGEADEADIPQQIAAATRRLARKQMGWFGRDSRITWLDAGAPDLVDRACAVVAEADRGVEEEWIVRPTPSE